MSGCDGHMYADDVQMHVSRPLCNINECIDITNRELANIDEWARNNGLALNPSKSNYIIVYKKPININRFGKIKLDYNLIKYVDHFNNLGRTLNNTQTWNDHITKIFGRT